LFFCVQKREINAFRGFTQPPFHQGMKAVWLTQRTFPHDLNTGRIAAAMNAT